MSEGLAKEYDVGLDDAQFLPALLFAYTAWRDIERVVIDPLQLDL